MSKNIEVSYFAMLRDQTSKSSEKRNTQAENMNDFFAEIDEEYKFEIKQNQLRVARNHEFVTWETKLEDGDIIAFIPPVSGG